MKIKKLNAVLCFLLPLAVSCLCRISHADALLIDVGDGGHVASSPAWTQAGVTEDLTGAAGAQISYSGALTLNDHLTASVSGNSTWPAYSATFSNDLLDDYMVYDSNIASPVSVSLGGFENTMTSTMSDMSGNSFTLQPNTAYKLYLFGIGDSSSQDTTFTFGGVSKTTVASHAIVDDHFVTFDLTTPSVLTGYTIDFSFEKNTDGRFSGWNGAALVPVAPSNAPPSISGLTDQSVGIGANVILNPTVTGTAPISYQWKENGMNLTGETNATLTLNGVQANQSGTTYTLTADNAFGSDSQSMTLTVASIESFTINVDLNNGGSYNYSGTALAPDSGTVWNNLDVGSSPSSLTISNVKDSEGNTLAGVNVTIASQNGDGISRWSNDALSTPNPMLLMRDYTFGNTYNVTVSGLPAGSYSFWYFGHGDQNDQAGTVALDSGNGGGSGSTASSVLGRDLFNGGEGISYASFSGKPVVDSGEFKFQVANFLNGFQLQLSAPPVVSGLADQTAIEGAGLVLSPTISGVPDPFLQWRTNGVAIAGETNATLTLNNVQYAQNGTEYSLLASNAAGSTSDSMILTVVVTPSIDNLDNQAVPPGSNVTMAPTVSGVPAPFLQWFYNGGLLSDGATGNGSTVSGSTSDTLSISIAQEADSGTYSLVASNSAGVVTNNATLTVSSTPVAPVITGPTDQDVVQGKNTTFSVSVSGLPLPTMQWQLNGTDIPGATNSFVTVNNAQYSQDGDVYSLVASNAAGNATNSATLHVFVPPTISQQPTNSSVLVGSPAMFSVTADGVPAVSYQWSRSGSPIAGATNSTFTVPNVTGGDNGATFSVEVANTIDSLISSTATLTVLSTMSGTLLPTNGATEIAPDQQLRIEFSGGTVKLGSGVLHVLDASDDSVFATIDTSEFITFINDGANVTNGAIRSLQGNNCYYEPIAIDGNTAWITLDSDERFEYGKSYYVTFNSGLFVDSTGASFPGITDATTWQFSTKSAGPGTPTTSAGPTSITVGLDGAGDFATLQGASDWIPQNNTLRRTITIAPGTYRDYAIFDQNRNNVNVIGSGASPEEVLLHYPYPSVPSGGIGILTLESSDINVFNLNLDTKAYEIFPGRMRSLITTGQRLVFANVLIKGGQDTLYAISGSAYFKDCEIWGSVDFIYGGALTVFDQCKIVQVRESGGPITAPNTDLNAPYGEVFLNCTFPRALVADGYPYDVGIGTTTFMRAWGKDGMTAIINCELGSQFSNVGWSDSWDSETTCRAREYGNYGPGAVSVATRQAAGAYWLNTIDPDYVANTSLPSTDPSLNPPTGHLNRTPVTVDPADFTIDAMFGHPHYGLGSWRPTDVLADPPVILMQPISRAAAPGSTIDLSVGASTSTGVTNYVWQVDSNSITSGNVSGKTSALLTITDFQKANEGYYRVMVSDGVGSTNSIDAFLTLATMPSMTIDGVDAGELTLQFPTEFGPTYLVQTNTDLTTTNWGDAEIIVGDGTIKPFVTGVTNAPNLFVRVKVQ